MKLYLSLRRYVHLTVLALLAASLAVAVNVSGASAANPKALINGDTVSGGSGSPEATAATALGFDVTVVDGATWGTMTAAQFAAYQVLIAGDPDCGDVAESFKANEAVWAPVVMGKAVHSAPGNRVLIGTDPVFHRGSNPGADRLISDGIAFAGAQPGRTGLYFDSSCDESGSVAPMMAALSAGTGTWTEDDDPPCGGDVAKIASNPKFDSLTTADLAGWSCSVHTAYPTFASDWSPLAIATDTTSHPTCGTDTTSSPPRDACGEAYILVAGAGVAVSSPDITLTPATGSDPVGGSHTVTATLSHSGTPIVGQKVTFTVTGVNAGAVGVCSPVTCITDSAGKVTFTYSDTNGAGSDTILAEFTSGGTTQQASATEEWTTGSPGAGSGGSAEGQGTTHCRVPGSARGSRCWSFSFRVADSGSGAGGSATVRTPKCRFVSTTVTSVAVSGNVADFTTTGKWCGHKGRRLVAHVVDGTPDQVRFQIYRKSHLLAQTDKAVQPPGYVTVTPFGPATS